MFVRGDTVSLELAGDMGKVACHIVVGGPDSSQVVMVGDDRIQYVDNSDLKLIDDDDFCGGCGQVGCSWG